MDGTRGRFLLPVLGLMLAGSVAGCDVVLRKLVGSDVDDMVGVYQGTWTLRDLNGLKTRRDGAADIRVGTFSNDVSGNVRIDRDRFPIEGRVRTFSGFYVRVSGGPFERSTRLQGHADCYQGTSCRLTLEGTAPGSGVRFEFDGSK